VEVSDRLPLDRTAVTAAERYLWAFPGWERWDSLTRMVQDLHAYVLRLEARCTRAEDQVDELRARVAELEDQVLDQVELPLGAVATIARRVDVNRGGKAAPPSTELQEAS